MKNCNHEFINEEKGECVNCGENDIRKIMNPDFGRKDVCTYLTCPKRGTNDGCEHFNNLLAN